MFFIYITFLAALLLEGLGTWVSVIGLSTLFGANPIILSLAVTLDIGKIVVVSLLYNHWKSLTKMMKVYALIAATVTMTITSSGAAGYLIGEFQKAIMGTQETSLKVDVLKEQQAKYELRKKQIDDQIASLPVKTAVTQRIRLMKQFKDEQDSLQAKINDIDQQLPDLQIKQIGVEAKAGPILYIAKAFKIPVEDAVKYVVGMIVSVFDPLAVFLIVAGNFLLAERRKPKPDDHDFDPDPMEPLTKEHHEKIAEAEPPLRGEILSSILSEPAKRHGEGHPPRGIASESLIPAMAVKEDSAPYETLYVSDDEPIAEPLQSEPEPTSDPEPIIVPSRVETPRTEIKLDDLKKKPKASLMDAVTPSRSSLNDARDDAIIHFDDGTQSAHSRKYK